MAGDYGELFMKLLRRALAAALLLIAGLSLGQWTWYPFLIFGGALLLAGPLAGLAGEFLSGFLVSRRTFDRPVPQYGIAEARRQEDRQEEAILQYRSITLSHPEETKPWLAMIEIAVVELGDPARARTIRDEALLRFARSPEREGFVQLSSQILTRSPRLRSPRAK